MPVELAFIATPGTDESMRRSPALMSPFSFERRTGARPASATPYPSSLVFSEVSSDPRRRPGLVVTTPRTLSWLDSLARVIESPPLSDTTSPVLRLSFEKYVSARSELPVWYETAEIRPVVDENEPPLLPKFIKRPAPVKAEVSWKSLRREAEVMVEE